MQNDNFDYSTAFSRNIGWITPAEQQVLQSKKVATAGLGGVGGNHLITLTRLGVGAFNLAEFDHFDVANFNRQAGANMTTVKQPKLDVVAGMARNINPELQLRTFPEGLTEDNLDDFLDGVDLYIDSLDFFALKMRRIVFAACAKRGIPAITVAPVGLGCTMLNFMPGKMTFEKYFRLEGQEENEQYLRFLVGLTPTRLQNGYLVCPEAVDLPNQRVPSTAMAIQLCSGVAVSQAFKILLNRGKVLAAPRGLQFDAYRNKLVTTWRPLGNANPLHRLAIALGRKKLLEALKSSEAPKDQAESEVEKILDDARWAPSGDNGQSWRFEVTGEHSLTIHAWDTRDEVIYDKQGHAGLIGIGALLESVRIAASKPGLHPEISDELEPDMGKYRFHIKLSRDEQLEPDPLAPYLPIRATHRSALSPRRLLKTHKRTLEQALPDGYQLVWMDGFRKKWRVTRLLLKNAGLRLTLPEAYETHHAAIDWQNRHQSPDRMPLMSLGASPVTALLMRFCMKSWERIRFFNTYLAGTLVPRLEMDLIPGLCCGAHFVLTSNTQPKSPEDFINAGKALQRFWLTATKLGLQLQPQYTPIVFHEYTRDKIRFSAEQRFLDKASEISGRFCHLLGKEQMNRAVYMGRIGYGSPATSRSTRLPLESLMYGNGDESFPRRRESTFI